MGMDLFFQLPGREGLAKRSYRPVWMVNSYEQRLLMDTGGIDIEI